MRKVWKKEPKHRKETPSCDAVSRHFSYHLTLRFASHSQVLDAARTNTRKMLQLPQEQSFALSLGIFQVICLIFFAAHFDTVTPKSAQASDSPDRSQGYYSMYMDVHVMIFVGFGFLMTYLRKYSLSAVSLNFVVGVMALQWGIITVTIAHQIGENEYPKAMIDIPALINGDFAAAAVLISFGAVLGKVTPTQLLWMAFFELIFYAINECILLEGLEIIDAGGSMVIHTFGAFFGLALSIQIGLPSSHEQVHNTSRYTSDLFAMIGTLFLWMFWPSFNAAIVPSDGFRQERAVVNTLLSIAASCASTFAATQVLSVAKKFDMVHLQNATLAGGVAMGAACELAINPASAVTIGLVAGFVSVFGYRFFTPALERRIRLSDSAGILNLHGMPGVIGGLACAFATMALSDDTYGGAPTSIYKAREHRSAGEQGGYQLLALVVTLGIALVSGTAIGMFLRSPLFRQQQMKYEDEEWFHLPVHPEVLPLGSSPLSRHEGESNFETQSPQTNYELISNKTS